jgi:hypothetical protein
VPPKTSSLKKYFCKILFPSSGDSRWPTDVKPQNILIQTQKKLVLSLFGTYSGYFCEDDCQQQKTDRHNDRPIGHDSGTVMSTCDCLDHKSLLLFYTVLMDLKFAGTIINIDVCKLPVYEAL